MTWKYVWETIFESVVIVGLCLGAAFLADYFGKKYPDRKECVPVQKVEEVR